MASTELKRIVEDLMVDEWNVSNDDYQKLTVDECRTVIQDIRKFQDDAELEPDERIPDTMTADELHSVWSEIVDEHWNRMKDNIRVYLLGEGNYDYPFNKYIESFRKRNGSAPHPWVYCGDQPFCGKDCSEQEYTPREFARIVMRSPDYDPDKPFYWYDGQQIHSCSNVFPEIMDPEKLIDYIVGNNDDLDDCDLADAMEGRC